MKGRKAIPNKIIKLRGGTEYTHRPERNEIDLPAKVPSCPSHLDSEGKKEWKKVVKLLEEMGVITEIDQTTLSIHCEAYSRWIQAKKKIQEDGMVYWRGRKEDKDGNVLNEGVASANPYIKILEEAEKQMIRVGSLFGLSPSSRASLSIGKEKPSKAKDKTDAFRRKKHNQ